MVLSRCWSKRSFHWSSVSGPTIFFIFNLQFSIFHLRFLVLKSCFYWFFFSDCSRPRTNLDQMLLALLLIFELYSSSPRRCRRCLVWTWDFWSFASIMCFSSVFSWFLKCILRFDDRFIFYYYFSYGSYFCLTIYFYDRVLTMYFYYRVLTTYFYDTIVLTIWAQLVLSWSGLFFLHLFFVGHVLEIATW